MKMTFRPLDTVSFRFHDNLTNKNVLKRILKIQTSSPFLIGYSVLTYVTVRPILTPISMVEIIEAVSL